MKGLALGRALFLLSTATAIGALWSHGKLEIFLNPRFAAPLPWVALVLLAMGLVELSVSGSKDGDGVIKIRHAIWFLPLIAGLALRPSGISGDFANSRGATAAGRMLAEAARQSDSFDMQGLEYAELTEIDSIAKDSVVPVSGDSDWIAPLKAVRSSMARPQMQVPPQTGIDVPTHGSGRRVSIWCDLPSPEGTVCVDTLRERFWYEQMLALYMDPIRHRGRRVRLVGMALRDASVEPGGWHVGRVMIWCCAADASPLGLHPIGKTTGEPLVEGGWVAIEGILDTRIAKLPGMSQRRAIPVLVDATAEPISPPQQENVFPFSY